MDFELENDVFLHGHTAGSGNVSTVLIHGWGVTGNIWAPVLDRWPTDCGMGLAIDLRGTGWSYKPATGYTLEAFGADVIGVLRQLPGPVVLVGHSMGGLIAQWVALQAPELVTRLVLVSPVPASGVPFTDADVAYFKSLAGRREGMLSSFSSMMVLPVSDDNRADLLAQSATVTPACYVEAFDAWRGANFADKVGGIAVPTTVFGGGAEQPLNPGVLQGAVVNLIPGATFQAIEGAGHFPHYEAVDRFSKALFAACQG